MHTCTLPIGLPKGLQLTTLIDLNVWRIAKSSYLKELYRVKWCILYISTKAFGILFHHLLITKLNSCIFSYDTPKLISIFKQKKI